MKGRLCAIWALTLGSPCFAAQTTACAEVAGDGALIMESGARVAPADVRIEPVGTASGRRARGVAKTACAAGAEPVAHTQVRDWRGQAYARLRFATREGGVADLSEVLLREGLARYAPRTEGAHPTLVSAERAARKARRGLWAEPEFAVRGPDADALMQDMETWAVVEGLVVAAKSQREAVFLNFGSDWRTDFTVAVPHKLVRDMEPAPETLAGAWVEVRGFVESANGPAIWLRHPEQLRVLE